MSFIDFLRPSFGLEFLYRKGERDGELFIERSVLKYSDIVGRKVNEIVLYDLDGAEILNMGGFISFEDFEEFKRKLRPSEFMKLVLGANCRGEEYNKGVITLGKTRFNILNRRCSGLGLKILPEIPPSEKPYIDSGLGTVKCHCGQSFWQEIRGLSTNSINNILG